MQGCMFFNYFYLGEERNETESEVHQYLIKKKLRFDVSLFLNDSLKGLGENPKFRLNDSIFKHTLIQTRIYNKDHTILTGYGQCFGDFEHGNLFDSIIPTREPYMFFNSNLNFKNEVELFQISDAEKQNLIEQSSKYDYTYVVYWTKWTKKYSMRLLKPISKLKEKYPDRIFLILANSAKDVDWDNY